MDYATYYSSIIKSFFAPPSWVFGLAWGIIYPLIIVALILLFRELRKGSVSKTFAWVFMANIAANLLFTPIQLSLQSTLLATLDILVVLGTLIYIEIVAWRKSKAIFWLLVPYLLWGLFATTLQISIFFLN